MAFFLEALPDVSLKFITETGEEIVHPGGKLFPDAAGIEALFEDAKMNRPAPVWSGDEECLNAGIHVPTLDGVLVCAVAGNQPAKKIWEKALQAAAKFSLVKLEERRLVAENGQLHRQIDVLKQQHGKLVDDNHRQYLHLQAREQEYAGNLEREIAKQTAELRKTNEELMQASRLKNEFLANMSHELRTPMNAIIGFSELLVETELNSVQEDYAQTIKQSGSGLLSLINDILDFAKIEADKLDIDTYPFKLSDVVTNVCSMFEKSAKAKGLQFHCRLDERLADEFVGDGNRLKQVLVNLSGNAMKFTEKGEVEVRADFCGREGDKVVVNFSVRDTGLGIAKDRHAAIFEKFVQEDGSITRKYGGTGLGLAISSKLVSLMGGSLSLESEVGKGSVFSFMLPLRCSDKQTEKGRSPDQTGGPTPSDFDAPSQPRSGETAKVEEAPAGDDTARKTVLLVEDNLVNQKLASVLIKKQGCDVVVAGDGLIALEKLKERRFDLILMDLQMPNMGGLDATKRIREIEQSSERAQYKGLQDPDRPVPIVGLSAHARKEDAEESMAAGMNDFLTKPIVKAKLEAVLARVDDA
jgi:signal transduction histidine kinase/CheY-like chemotaxis protein